MPQLRVIWQLFPTYLLIMLLSLVAVAWYASSSVTSFYISRASEDQAIRARLFAPLVSDLIEVNNSSDLATAVRGLADSNQSRITVLRPDGRVIADSHESVAQADLQLDRPEIARARLGETGFDVRYNRAGDEELLYVAVPVHRDNRLIGIIRTAGSIQFVTTAVRELQVRIALGGMVIGLIAALVSLGVSRRMARPLEELRSGAQRFARGDFSQRVLAEESEETAGLASAMNEMARQLDDRIQTMTRQRNEQEAILASMVEGVLAVDSEERLMNFNSAAIRLLGEGQRLTRGRTIQEVIRNTDLQRLVAETLRSNQPVEQEIVLAEPQERYLQAYGSKLRDQQGAAIGALLVLHDITRLRKLENVRRDFVANVSHELKTPITSIKGFVETLQEGAIREPADAERFLGIIARQADRLSSIIEDLLSLSRIEQDAEKGQIALESGSVREMLEGAIQVCRTKAQDKGIEVLLDCPSELMTAMNPVLLEQAVVNLIDNAIKYSNKGQQVRVTGELRGHEIALTVADQGPGIEPQHLPRLWERFYRVDRARSRDLGGTGLGLAIVKHITLAHSGQVAVTSTVGAGSMFSILLPRR